MQFLFKIEIFNKNNNKWRNCLTPHINPRQISALGPTTLSSRVDMGYDTDFAMYYTLFINLIVLNW